MSKQTYIDGNKTLIDTDYYLKLLNCQEENKKLKEQLGNRIVEFGYKENKYKFVLEEIREYILENKNKTIAPYGDNTDYDYEICLYEEDIHCLLKILDKVGKE